MERMAVPAVTRASVRREGGAEGASSAVAGAGVRASSMARTSETRASRMAVCPLSRQVSVRNWMATARPMLPPATLPVTALRCRQRAAL